MGAPKVQATAPQLRPRGKLQDSEVHFRGDRSLASGSAFAPLLREPARWGGRKKEPRAASRQPAGAHAPDGFSWDPEKENLTA